MKTQRIQELINNYNYWDMRVISLECNYFADEVALIYDDLEGHYIKYLFKGCYRILFEHIKSYEKVISPKDMSLSRNPYFLQDVTIGDIIDGDVYFYTCSINMFPMDLEIWCKDIIVDKKDKILI